jgi:CRP-like cAMP-binding protein
VARKHSASSRPLRVFRTLGASRTHATLASPPSLPWNLARRGAFLSPGKRTIAYNNPRLIRRGTLLQQIPSRDTIPMMDRSGIPGNGLLAMLPRADFGLLAPHLHKISLEQDAVLLRTGDRIQHVYFPHSGAISFMLDMTNGQTVATAVVGSEGAVGILSLLGPARSSVTAVVRVAGAASQISASRFQAAFRQSGAIRDAVQSYTRALLVQFQHGAACNALHPVEARTARWLLHIHDLIDRDVMPLTQETLSQLLGVRRTTVTQVIQKLRADGVVRSERRGMIEIDRPRLERAACECYEIMRHKVDDIIHESMSEHADATRVPETPNAVG